jgi:hypothetical protein
MTNGRYWQLPGMFLALLVLAAPALGQDDASAGRKLVLDDMGSVQTPGSPRISPDGRQVAYYYDQQVYVTSPEGGAPRPITSTAVMSMEPALVCGR